MRVVISRSNPVAPDPRVEKIAVSLAQGGHVVRIVCWDRAGEHSRPGGLPAEEQVAGAACSRLPIRAEYANGIRNFPALLRWQLALAGWLVARRREYDTIHACDFDTVIPALLCKWLFGKRVVYDIFDFYADHLRRTPSVIKRLIRWVDLRAIGKADALILVDDSRWEQIRGAHPRRSAVIYNSPADAGPANSAVTGSRPKNSTLHLAYIGLLQVERGLVELLDVLARHPTWSLDLAGFGGDEGRLLEQARRLPNVRWHGRVNYPQALAFSRLADALIATYDPAIPNHRYSSPNKIFEAMLLGKPVIVATGTNMDRLVEAAGCGLVVPYGDIPALESTLARLEADPGLRQRLGASARRAYDTTYSWAQMQSRLQELYASL